MARLGAGEDAGDEVLHVVLRHFGCLLPAPHDDVEFVAGIKSMRVGKRFTDQDFRRSDRRRKSTLHKSDAIQAVCGVLSDRNQPARRWLDHSRYIENDGF